MTEFTSKSMILILFANAYEMKDDSGSLLSGCTVHYLFWGDNDMDNMLTYSESDARKPVGIQRAKCSIDFDLRSKIMIAPALYEGTFEMSVGSDGKPVLRLKDVAFVDCVEIKRKHVPGIIVPGMLQQKETVSGSKPRAAEK